MNKKKRMLLLLLTMLALVGCGDKENDEGYLVFYTNSDVTALSPQETELTSTKPQEMAEELLALLKEQPKDADLRQTIPEDVDVQAVTLDGYQITVDFSAQYYEMDTYEEILTRAAVAKTLLQIPDYPYVAFTVDGKALSDASGAVVGAMSADSFVENPGESISSSQRATLTLYFADESGEYLVPETREVYYSSNVSLEKLVMEQLMEGPDESGLLATVPSGTKLITVTTADHVCYVNLDDAFLNQNQEISEQVVLYSIVDSLTEIEGVDKVQLSINGDTSGKCRYSYKLSEMYTQDLGIVREQGEEELDSTQ